MGHSGESRALTSHGNDGSLRMNRGDVAMRRVDVAATRGRFNRVESKGVFRWV